MSEADIARVAALAKTRRAEGGRFAWHKWYAWRPVYLSGQWFQGFACFEWLWRVRSVDDTIWWYCRVYDYPNGPSRCGTCGDGADNRLPYGTQPCLTEPDKAHFRCILGYGVLSKNEYRALHQSGKMTEYLDNGGKL